MVYLQGQAVSFREGPGGYPQRSFIFQLLVSGRVNLPLNPRTWLCVSIAARVTCANSVVRRPALRRLILLFVAWPNLAGMGVLSAKIPTTVDIPAPVDTVGLSDIHDTIYGIMSFINRRLHRLNHFKNLSLLPDMFPRWMQTIPLFWRGIGEMATDNLCLFRPPLLFGCSCLTLFGDNSHRGPQKNHKPIKLDQLPKDTPIL